MRVASKFVESMHFKPFAYARVRFKTFCIVETVFSQAIYKTKLHLNVKT